MTYSSSPNPRQAATGVNNAAKLWADLNGLADISFKGTETRKKLGLVYVFKGRNKLMWFVTRCITPPDVQALCQYDTTHKETLKSERTIAFKRALNEARKVFVSIACANDPSLMTVDPPPSATEPV